MLKYGLVRRHPVFSFYLLTFFVSWVGGLALVAASHGYFALYEPSQSILLVLFAIGPALSAIVVKQITCANSHEPKLIGSLWPAQHHWHWYAVVLLFPLALILPLNVIANLQLSADDIEMAPLSLNAVISSFLISCLANPCEEVGWRGFALPRLQKHIGENFAAVVIGVMTGIWHLPLFWMRDGTMSSFPFLYWLPGSIAISFLLMWIYNQSGQSLFLSSLLHISMNTWFNIVGIKSFQAYALTSFAVIAAFLISNHYRKPKQLPAIDPMRYLNDDGQSDPPKSPACPKSKS